MNFFFFLTWSRVCVMQESSSVFTPTSLARCHVHYTLWNFTVWRRPASSWSRKTAVPSRTLVTRAAFFNASKKEKSPGGQRSWFFFFFPTTVQTLTWKEAELCCDTVFCSECDGTGPAWKWRAEWQGSIWNLDVQSYIYNVDEFKFYFYREDFSPLKLCLEWQNCFYY